MTNILARRRDIRANVSEWAIEALATYGDEAGRVLRVIETRYHGAERYAFRQVRKAVEREQGQSSRLGVILKWLAECVIKGPTLGARVR